MLRFKLDWVFFLLILLAIPFWLALFLNQSIEHEVKATQLFALVAMYPLVEEFLFRGIIQPSIEKKVSRRFYNLSLANFQKMLS